MQCISFQLGWLVVLRFNATLTAKVMSWRSVTHMCFLAFSHQYLHSFSFQSHRLLFSHASAEVRGENTPEKNVNLNRVQLGEKNFKKYMYQIREFILYFILNSRIHISYYAHRHQNATKVKYENYTRSKTHVL